jgi:hypothetical protein
MEVKALQPVFTSVNVTVKLRTLGVSRMPTKRFTVSLEELEETTFGDSTDGICLSCGERQSGCEPDARRYKCESCGENNVFGIPDAVMSGQVDCE